MSVISKGRHDIVIKQEGKVSGGFFKVTKKHCPMYPFKEEKIKVLNREMRLESSLYNERAFSVTSMAKSSDWRTTS